MIPVVFPTCYCVGGPQAVVGMCDSPGCFVVYFIRCMGRFKNRNLGVSKGERRCVCVGGGGTLHGTTDRRCARCFIVLLRFDV